MGTVLGLSCCSQVSFSHTPLDDVKIRRELLLSNIAIGNRLGKAETCVQDAQTVRMAADAKLLKDAQRCRPGGRAAESAGDV